MWRPMDILWGNEPRRFGGALQELYCTGYRPPCLSPCSRAHFSNKKRAVIFQSNVPGIPLFQLHTCFSTLELWIFTSGYPSPGSAPSLPMYTPSSPFSERCRTFRQPQLCESLFPLSTTDTSLPALLDIRSTKDIHLGKANVFPYCIRRFCRCRSWFLRCHNSPAG